VRKRIAIVRLAVCFAAVLGPMVGLACAQNTRAAIEAQYQRLATAIRQKDVDSILSIQAPNFTSRNPTGTSFDYAAMADYTRRLTASVDSVIHIRNVIRRFQGHGDTAVADVCQEFSRMQRFGDGRPRRVDTSALQEETWVRTSGGWKRQHVENVRGTRWFVDGVRLDPTKPFTPRLPAYVPDVDPPTGCGVR
jgi:hypothetical protein